MKRLFGLVVAFVVAFGQMAEAAPFDMSRAVWVEAQFGQNMDYSPYYEELFKVARDNGLKEMWRVDSYYAPLTRAYISFFAVSAYYKMTGAKRPDRFDNPFTDLGDPQGYMLQQGLINAYTLSVENAPLFARNLKLISGVAEGLFKPNDTVNREGVAEMLSNMASVMNLPKGEMLESALDAFVDKGDISNKKAVAFAVSNGLMGGVSQNSFGAKENATIEQGAAAVLRFFVKYGQNLSTTSMSVTSHKQNQIIPLGNVDVKWSDPGAKSDTSYSVSIYSQMGTHSLVSKKVYAKDGMNLTIQRDLLVRENCKDLTFYITANDGRIVKPVRVYFDSSGIIFTGLKNNEKELTVLDWLSVDGATDYRVEVREYRRECLYSDEIPPAPLKTYKTGGKTTVSLSCKSNYHDITVAALDANGNAIKSAGVLLAASAKYVNNGLKFAQNEIGFATEAEARAYMQNITVNVWKVDSKGNKYASKAQITVHKNAAQIFTDIFQEIFDGDEKFPIKDVGGFSWRGNSASEHNNGLAVDINYDENYCPSRSVGSFWKPYENQYSITPYGDVVRAFENHGFGWLIGDYMHFSYNGK